MDGPFGTFIEGKIEVSTFKFTYQYSAGVHHERSHCRWPNEMCQVGNTQYGNSTPIDEVDATILGNEVEGIPASLKRSTLPRE